MAISIIMITMRIILLLKTFRYIFFSIRLLRPNSRSDSISRARVLSSVSL